MAKRIRRIFLDIGGWNGASAVFFRKYHPRGSEFEIFTFECDKKNIETIKKRQLPITLIEMAAWVYTGAIDFYYSGSHTQAGGTLYSQKKTGGISPGKYYKVPCLDLAEFIKLNFKKEDEIIIKMNCEGAEYDIINHMFKNDLITWVNKWYVQWHWDKINMSVLEHNRICNMLPEWHEWDCQCHEDTFKTKFQNSL